METVTTLKMALQRQGETGVNKHRLFITDPLLLDPSLTSGGFDTELQMCGENVQKDDNRLCLVVITEVGATLKFYQFPANKRANQYTEFNNKMKS